MCFCASIKILKIVTKVEEEYTETMWKRNTWGDDGIIWPFTATEYTNHLTLAEPENSACL